MVQIVQGQFGQDVIRQILKDLGGRATAKQIAEECTKRYDKGIYGVSLADTVSIKLQRMQKWHEVYQKYDKQTKQWQWILRETP